MSLINPHTFITALVLASRYFASPTVTVTVEVAKTICADGKLAAENPRAAFFRQLVHDSDFANYPMVPNPKDTPMKVGIVGRGAAGLYAAMLLDSINIDHNTHDASDRIGGRIFIYHFDPEQRRAGQRHAARRSACTDFSRDNCCYSVACDF